jgi:hypothetical protein
VKVIDADGSDELAATPFHSGYSALFYHLDGCKHGVISFVYISWFSVPYKVPISSIKGPLHSTPSRAKPIAHLFFFFFARSIGGTFSLVLQCCPLLLVRHICLCGPLKNQIFNFFDQKHLNQILTHLYCPRQNFTRSKEFNCPHTNEPKILVDHIWSLGQLGVKIFR